MHTHVQFVRTIFRLPPTTCVRQLAACPVYSFVQWNLIKLNWIGYQRYVISYATMFIYYVFTMRCVRPAIFDEIANIEIFVWFFFFKITVCHRIGKICIPVFSICCVCHGLNSDCELMFFVSFGNINHKHHAFDWSVEFRSMTDPIGDRNSC